jgi:flavin-dependent dehydrogenase
VSVRENCLVRGFSQQDKTITVDVLRKDLKLLEPPGGNTNQILTCDYLVGADGGSSSKIRQILDPVWFNEAKMVVIYQAYYPVQDMGSLTEGNWNVFFEPQIGEMLSCVHRKDAFLTLCVGGFKGRDLQASMKTFKIFLKNNYNVVLEQEERVEGCMLREATPHLGAGNVLITGEAAGFMYLNGEGISAAIDSGYRAGQALAQAIKQGGDALEFYRQNTVDILQHIQFCRQKAHFLAV